MGTSEREPTASTFCMWNGHRLDPLVLSYLLGIMSEAGEY
jgi:hypothetical protein